MNAATIRYRYFLLSRCFLCKHTNIIIHRNTILPVLRGCGNWSLIIRKVFRLDGVRGQGAGKGIWYLELRRGNSKASGQNCTVETFTVLIPRHEMFGWLNDGRCGHSGGEEKHTIHAYSILMWKSEAKTPLGITRRRCERNTEKQGTL